MEKTAIKTKKNLNSHTILLWITVGLFILLYALSRKVPARPRGTFLGVFLIVYGICRFALEFVRQPDAQLGYLWGGWLTMGQCLSFPLIIAGVCLLVWACKRKLPQQGLPD